MEVGVLAPIGVPLVSAWLERQESLVTAPLVVCIDTILGGGFLPPTKDKNPGFI